MADYAQIIQKAEDFHEEASKMLALVSTAAPEDLKQIPAVLAGLQRRAEQLRGDLQAFMAGVSNGEGC